MTLGCVHVFVLLGEGIPLTKLFIPKGGLLLPPRGEHVLKRAQVIAVRKQIAKTCFKFIIFFNVSQTEFLSKSLTESEQSDQFEHVI